jgi:hypothetical protein
MPGSPYDGDADVDPQDLAEAFDESTTLGEAEDGFQVYGADEPRTFEELPDVYDVTTRTGDRDDDEARALDADAFDEDAFDDADVEDDHELDYAAADAEREDELDGLGAGPAGGYDDGQLSARDIEGLEEVRDAGEVSGGEDDVGNFQSKGLTDRDLKDMGYSETRQGETRARPDPRARRGD